MILITMDYLQELRRIEAQVRRNLPVGYDRESLAADLWLESWQQDRRLSNREIRYRCLDLVRSQREHSVDRVERPDPPLEGDETLARRLDELKQRAQLSAMERKVLYLSYNEGLTIRQAAGWLHVGVKRVAELKLSAEQKLRETAKGGETEGHDG